MKGCFFMTNNKITELVFIIDKSGSMRGLETDTIGGFNAMLDKQKKEEGTCLVSTVLFDTDSKVIHDRADLSDIRPMEENDYCPSGCTALMDAVGEAIHHIGNVHKYIRTEDVPEHTVFVITTDGMENASRRYTREKLKAMIEEKKEKNNWEFLFIGANIDAVTTAEQYGISEDRAVNYCADEIGTQVLYDSVSSAVSGLRKYRDIPSAWSANIERDYKRRKRRS